MVKVIGVRFRTAGKIYFFAPGQFDIKQGDQCDRGNCPRRRVRAELSADLKEVDDEEVIQPLKSVIQDCNGAGSRKTVSKNKQKEKEAFQDLPGKDP